MLAVAAERLVHQSMISTVNVAGARGLITGAILSLFSGVFQRNRPLSRSTISDDDRGDHGDASIDSLSERDRIGGGTPFRSHSGC